MAFARAHGKFQDLGCDLLGLSVDSVFSHIAWVRSIRDTFGVEVPFPIAEDLSMAIASAYGMVRSGDSDTAAVRGTFLIDPTGIVRLVSYYPMTTGRNVDEFLRALAALQETDASGISTPAGWQPGEPGVMPPPALLHDADARTDAGAPTWYYQPKPTRR